MEPLPIHIYSSSCNIKRSTCAQKLEYKRQFCTSQMMSVWSILRCEGRFVSHCQRELRPLGLIFLHRTISGDQTWNTLPVWPLISQLIELLRASQDNYVNNTGCHWTNRERLQHNLRLLAIHHTFYSVQRIDRLRVTSFRGLAICIASLNIPKTRQDWEWWWVTMYQAQTHTLSYTAAAAKVATSCTMYLDLCESEVL